VDDDDLRQMFSRTLSRLEPPSARPNVPVVATRRRSKKRLAILAVGVVTFVGSAVLPLGSPLLANAVGSARDAFFGTGRAPSPQFSPQPTSVNDMERSYSEEVYGINVTLPESWNLLSDPLPVVTDPRTLFYAGPAELVEGDFCAVFDHLPSDGVVVAALERFDLEGLGGDPINYPNKDGSLAWDDASGPVDCRPEGTIHDTDAARFQFSEDGRYLEAWVAIGPTASSTERDAALDVVNSISVQPDADGR
jgi:hypothetical protein